MKITRRNIYIRANTDNIIEMPRLLNNISVPIDLTNAIFIAKFKESEISEESYIIPVTTNLVATDGIYFLNINSVLSDIAPRRYIYQVDVVISNLRTAVSSGILEITSNTSI